MTFWTSDDDRFSIETDDISSFRLVKNGASPDTVEIAMVNGERFVVSIDERNKILALTE